MPARKIVAIRIATRMGRIKWPPRVESIRRLKNDRMAIREKEPQKFDWTGLHQFVFETLPVYSLVGSAVVVRKPQNFDSKRKNPFGRYVRYTEHSPCH